ncbi:MbnP family protein [Hymenobacter chitinivorans]|uniref:Copper-binding protein MbnP-like domain-containing protein n=1 Tax=Hymenobacter chitinivorans DSM 11115 TaxID=1121954 RepID=A0A2M9BN03_9BACT|nr:MbnP family protein [Hymenobacter chitinivorans]PJJ59327.1 hypothetical protein CLV45_0744 [Hymenobacter chitinivorans DSM 11115]
MKFYQLFLALAALSVSFSSCKKDADAKPQVGKLDLEMDHVVGASSLVLNAATPNYSTPSGDHFSVSTLRYYISNIRLRKEDGSEYVQPESYYLVDAARPDSKVLTLDQVPVGDYTGITFTIGVDAARNTAGAQQGALSPSDMFWSWNTGYIFLKLEGKSPEASAGAFTYHIGGFEGPNNAIRTVSPAFPSGTKLLIRTDHAPEMHLKVDVLKILTGPTEVRFATFSAPHMPGAAAVQLADNYAAGMFRIDHIHAN